MADAVESDPIVREIYVDAEPATVFAFFTEADKLTRWLARDATLDARPGGECLQVHVPEGERGGGPFHMRGTFVEVVPPERVVFTWGFVESEVEVAPGESTVEVTFTAEGAGTRLRLVHRGLPAQEYENHARGWTTMLERLARAVTPVETTKGDA
jgi:uncharacterized protein YndB with AHSA1/START domain